MPDVFLGVWDVILWLNCVGRLVREYGHDVVFDKKFVVDAKGGVYDFGVCLMLL